MLKLYNNYVNKNKLYLIKLNEKFPYSRPFSKDVYFDSIIIEIPNYKEFKKYYKKWKKSIE